MTLYRLKLKKNSNLVINNLLLKTEGTSSNYIIFQLSLTAATTVLSGKSPVEQVSSPEFVK